MLLKVEKCLLRQSFRRGQDLRAERLRRRRRRRSGLWVPMRAGQQGGRGRDEDLQIF